jgi:integrase
LRSFRDKPFAGIATQSIKDCLEPFISKIPATAEKTRGMLEQILASAISLGLRPAPNPATRENLSTVFKKKKGEQAHHAAMPYDDVPDFLATLRANPSTAALALEFCILTATRSGETRFARWDEFDGKTWTIPAARMKAGREHKIPLADRCCAILETLAANRSGDFVFAGSDPNAPVGKMAMPSLLPRGATLHGMRSAFADWTGEETEHPREIAEHALAHAVGNGTERAYRRKTAFKHRIELMAEWAKFCTRGSRKVVPIRA